jgi:hypothetical protein
MSLDFDVLDEIADRTMAHIERQMMLIDQSVKGSVPGTRDARGVENALAAQQLVAKMPPEQWIKPDGELVLMSPWMADLESGLVMGGKEELDKINEGLGEMRKVAGLG